MALFPVYRIGPTIGCNLLFWEFCIPEPGNLRDETVVFSASAFKERAGDQFDKLIPMICREQVSRWQSQDVGALGL